MSEARLTIHPEADGAHQTAKRRDEATLKRRQLEDTYVEANDEAIADCYDKTTLRYLQTRTESQASQYLGLGWCEHDQMLLKNDFPWNELR